jgi:hypothetical protein
MNANTDGERLTLTTKLDRDLQRRVLTHLSALYPESGQWLRAAFPDVTRIELNAHLRYLAEHGLIRVVWFGVEPVEAILTARGADFLADDGGLSAILNVVTVRLDADSLKALLIEQVEKSEGESSAKEKLIGQIKALSSKALETAVTETVKKGLPYVPDTVTWLGEVLKKL